MEKTHEVDACTCAFGPHMCTGKQNTRKLRSLRHLLKQMAENVNIQGQNICALSLQFDFPQPWDWVSKQNITNNLGAEIVTKTMLLMMMMMMMFMMVMMMLLMVMVVRVKKQRGRSLNSGQMGLRSLGSHSTFSPSGKVISLLQFSCFHLSPANLCF